MSFADADAVARCSFRLPVSNLLVLIKAPRNSGRRSVPFSLSRRMAEHCVAACVQMIQFLITAASQQSSVDLAQNCSVIILATTRVTNTVNPPCSRT